MAVINLSRAETCISLDEFNGCIFALTPPSSHDSYEINRYNDVRDIIIKNGGIVKPVYTAKTDFLILDTPTIHYWKYWTELCENARRAETAFINDGRPNVILSGTILHISRLLEGE